MKTIGEMLVETTTCRRNAGFLLAGALAGAREIVATIYGSPCNENKGQKWFDGVMYPGRITVVIVEGQLTPRPSDVCSECGWPRGEHK